MPVQKFRRYNARIYKNHIIVDELQALFVFKNETINVNNCGILNPYPMEGDIVIYMENARNQRDTSNSNPLIMIKNETMNASDPENIKFNISWILCKWNLAIKLI